MSSADADQELADLPEDLLSGSIYPLLPAYSLRAAAATSNSWRRALIQAPAAVRRRASWRHGWTETGAGASRHPVDFAMCAADGSWHPGGAALASSLHFSVGEDVGFRLIIEEVALCGSRAKHSRPRTMSRGRLWPRTRLRQGIFSWASLC